MILILLALLPLLFFFFFFFFKHSRSNTKNLPPGPNLLVMLRNISQLLKNPHIALQNLSKIYGPLISLRIGGQIIVVASTPAMAEEIYKTHNRVFSGRFLPSVHYIVPGTKHASLVMARECNDTWKFLSGIGHKSIFSSTAIESASTIRTTQVMEMVKFLRNSKEGKVVNIEDAVFATFTNIITNVLTSRNLFGPGGEGESDEKVMSFLNELIEKVTTLGLTDVFPILERVDFWSQGRTMDIYRTTKLIWGDIIKERRERHDSVETKSTQDFLDVLIGHSFSDDEIAILLTELLTAGTDSTTITAVWLMAELIKNRETFHKVRKEITDHAIQHNTLSESLLLECQYFQACIKETLRLHVPGPLAIPRRAIEMCNINKYTIPKDSIVLVNLWAIQMDLNNWKDVTKFKPERFLNSTIDFKGADFQFIPFSAGVRKCPGSNVAVREVQLIVASLVYYFDWSLPNGKEWSELDLSDRFRTTLKKDKPFYLIPKGRGN